jgi:MFS family permease
MDMLGDERDKYGRVRMGGTFGWGIAAPIAGLLVQNYGIRLAFWTYAAIMFVALLVSRGFVFRTPAAVASARGGVRRLLNDRRWVYRCLMCAHRSLFSVPRFVLNVISWLVT